MNIKPNCIYTFRNDVELFNFANYLNKNGYTDLWGNPIRNYQINKSEVMYINGSKSVIVDSYDTLRKDHMLTEHISYEELLPKIDCYVVVFKNGEVGKFYEVPSNFVDTALHYKNLNKPFKFIGKTEYSDEFLELMIDASEIVMIY